MKKFKYLSTKQELITNYVSYKLDVKLLYKQKNNYLLNKNFNKSNAAIEF